MNTTKYNKFLVLISIVILLSGAYIYFYNGSKSEAANSSSSLSSSLDSSLGDPNAPVDNQIANETAFLSSLSLLKNIKIDTAIFTNKSFNLLKDNYVSLEEVTPGRPNPFAPIDSNSFSSSNSSIVTNESSQITSKGAVLNGSLSSTIKAQSVFFEYGSTMALGKVTSNAEQSLLGTFVVNISSLTPKTTYYFRAAARVLGTILYGEVVSFTTN